MRRALAAGLLTFALAAQAQAPPEPTPADTQPAVPSPAPSTAGEASPLQTTASPSPAAERPAAKPVAPKAPGAKAAAPAPPAGESARDAEVAALRAEVSRLQSELDAEHAATVAPAAEIPPDAPPARSPWGWFVTTALLALTAGFVLGWRLLDRRIRARYGGLRIY